MFGYTYWHESAINAKAEALAGLAREYRAAVGKAASAVTIPGWNSPAGDAQRKKINDVLSAALETADELESISAALYRFTAEHKTWLEKIVDTVDDIID